MAAPTSALGEEPESRAGRRVVSFPREVTPELRWHLERFVVPAPESLVFAGPNGGRLHRQNFGSRPRADQRDGLRVAGAGSHARLT